MYVATKIHQELYAFLISVCTTAINLMFRINCHVFIISYASIRPHACNLFSSSYTLFLDEKIELSSFLLPRRQHFLMRKFNFQHFY